MADNWEYEYDRVRQIALQFRAENSRVSALAEFVEVIGAVLGSSAPGDTEPSLRRRYA